MSIGPDMSRHPCFNAGAESTCGRVHLPVAPKCNIKCNYCNRKSDCVNESRPGVTSAVLAPVQAVRYLEEVLERAPHITVAGIAGPGDAFAEPETTMKTLRLVRERFPELILCLATNGLNVGDYIAELADLKVSHVTMTVNAVDAEIGSGIYAWVRKGRVVYRGKQAAEMLLERQLEALKSLKAHNMIVKVNTIVVPGVNDHHVTEVSQKMAELGVDIQNCMAMYPNAGAPLGNIPEPTHERMLEIRTAAEKIIPQMKHCSRCRADAVGLLKDDRSPEFRDVMRNCSLGVNAVLPDKQYVAVASREGMLVNEHLGEAERFQIWGLLPAGYTMLEERTAPLPGTGIHRWLALAELLKDCRAVLVNAAGETPVQILADHDIHVIEMTGFIQAGLDVVYVGGDPNTLKGRKGGCAKSAGSCSGSGAGCG